MYKNPNLDHRADIEKENYSNQINHSSTCLLVSYEGRLLASGCIAGYQFSLLCWSQKNSHILVTIHSLKWDYLITIKCPIMGITIYPIFKYDIEKFMKQNPLDYIFV